MKKKVRLTILLLFITIIIFYMLFLKVDFNQLVLNLKSIKISYLLMALAISAIFNIFICAYKLKMEIKIMGVNIPFKESLFIKLSSYLLMLVSPFKAGEVVNAFYLKKVYQLKFIKGIGVIVIDRIMSLVGLLFFVFLGLSLFLGLYPPLLIFILLTFMLLFLKYILKILPKKIRTVNYLRRIKFRSLLYLTLVSTVVNLSKIINILIFLKIFDIKVPMATLVLFTSLAILLSSLPITIAGLGTREASIIYFFVKYASYETLFSVGLLLSFVEYIFPALVGLIFVNKFLRRTFK